MFRGAVTVGRDGFFFRCYACKIGFIHSLSVEMTNEIRLKNLVAVTNEIRLKNLVGFFCTAPYCVRKKI